MAVYGSGPEKVEQRTLPDKVSLTTKAIHSEFVIGQSVEIARHDIMSNSHFNSAVGPEGGDFEKDLFLRNKQELKLYCELGE